MLHLSPLPRDILLMPPRRSQKLLRLSPSSRAMTRCPSSAGWGLSASLAFGVAKDSLLLLRDMREPERFGFQGMHPVSARVGVVLSGDLSDVVLRQSCK